MPTCEIHADCTYKNSLLGYVECTSRATLPWLFGYSLTDASPISSSSSTSSSSSSSSSQAAKQPSSQAAAAAAAAGAAGAATAAAAAAAVPSPKSSSSSSSSRRAAGGPSDRYTLQSLQRSTGVDGHVGSNPSHGQQIPSGPSSTLPELQCAPPCHGVDTTLPELQ